MLTVLVGDSFSTTIPTTMVGSILVARTGVGGRFSCLDMAGISFTEFANASSGLVMSGIGFTELFEKD